MEPECTEMRHESGGTLRSLRTTTHRAAGRLEPQGQVQEMFWTSDFYPTYSKTEWFRTHTQNTGRYSKTEADNEEKKSIG